jgi:hypothetical protein
VDVVVGLLNVNFFQRGGFSGQLSEDKRIFTLMKQVQTRHWLLMF